MNFFDDCRRIAQIAIQKGWAKLPEPSAVDPYLEAHRTKCREAMRRLHDARKKAGLTIYGTKRIRKTKTA